MERLDIKIKYQNLQLLIFGAIHELPLFFCTQIEYRVIAIDLLLLVE
jgi:hypothetical protein